MTTGFVERLTAARIGSTFNQYADSGLRRERLVRYLRERRRAWVLLVGEAPGYRGARVSGIPFTSERQLSGSGPAEATATIVRRTLAELGLEGDVLLWNLVPTHPGTAVASPTPASAARTSATRRTGAPRPSARVSRRRCSDRVGRWSASRFAATRSCSRRR